MMNTYNWVTLEYINEPLLVEKGANEAEEKEKAIQEMRVMFDAIISAVARTCDRLASGDLTAGSVVLKTSEDQTVTPVSNARDADGNKRNARVVFLPGKFDPLTIGHIRLIFESFAQGADYVVTMQDEYDERKAGLSGRTIREADTKWLYDALNGFLVEPTFQCERRSLLDCDGEAILPTLIYENRTIAEEVTWIYLAGYDHFNWTRRVPDALMTLDEFNVQISKYAVDPEEMHELLKANKMVDNFKKFQRNLTDLPEIQRRALIAEVEKRWPNQSSFIIPLLNGLVQYLVEIDTPTKLAHTQQMMLSLNMRVQIGGFITKRDADSPEMTDKLIQERHDAIESLCKIAEIDYYDQVIKDWLAMSSLPDPFKEKMEVFQQRLQEWKVRHKDQEIKFDRNGQPHDQPTMAKIREWQGSYRTALNTRLATNVRVTNWTTRFEKSTQWQELQAPGYQRRHVLSDLFDQLLGLTDVDNFDQFFAGLDAIIDSTPRIHFTVAKSPSRTSSSRLRAGDAGHSMPLKGFQHATSFALHPAYKDDAKTTKDMEIAAKVIGSLMDMHQFKYSGGSSIDQKLITDAKLIEILGNNLCKTLNMAVLKDTLKSRARDTQAAKERSPLMTRNKRAYKKAEAAIEEMIGDAYGRGLSAIDKFLSTCFKNDNLYAALRHTIAEGVYDDIEAMKLVRRKIALFRNMVKERCMRIYEQSEQNPYPMSASKRAFILHQLELGKMTVFTQRIVEASS
ncbi:MAG: hypothetical protein JW774_05520, partial [Candidatus Aureabacteria bacterium]|nr:hypothetical protein [Candidatus Auribacterota bacterium]